MRTRVWTERRKALGNLIPGFIWAVPTVAGLVVMVLQGNLLGPGIWLLIAGTASGWLATGLFGLWDNARMRDELRGLLTARGEKLDDSHFVGFASPRYTGLLDAHEDVGFLILKPDRLRFVGEHRIVEVHGSDISQVRLRPSVHTVIGLGGWVSVEGQVQGQPIRVSFEPRERPTMFGNARRRRSLRTAIEMWRKGLGRRSP
ncbi:hypothetical protein EON79_07405 [bacterium]|nr:MAG: hypothetical protein EON79_07405 [bacterium]